MTIDTKKAREMRAKGTVGKWFETNNSELFAEWVPLALTPGNRALVLYAVNELVPMADEIDRLRAALQRILDDAEDNAVAAIADDAITGRTVELSCSCVNPTYDKTHLICVGCKKKVDTSK